MKKTQETTINKMGQTFCWSRLSFVKAWLVVPFYFIVCLRKEGDLF
jgi:hypothetical protein